jgi:hypothetical protein
MDSAISAATLRIIHSRCRTAWRRDRGGLLSKPYGSPLQPRVARGNAATAQLRLAQEVRQLGDVGCDPSRFVAVQALRGHLPHSLILEIDVSKPR